MFSDSIVYDSSEEGCATSEGKLKVNILELVTGWLVPFLFFVPVCHVCRLMQGYFLGLLQSFAMIIKYENLNV